MREGWSYKRLGEVTSAINGLWTGKKPPFINIAVVRNTNFTKDCELDMTDVAYIDVEEKQYTTRKLFPGDIIIEKSGGTEKQPVGRAVLFNIKDGEYSFSNFTAALRIIDNSKLLPTFLHKFLQAKYKQGVTRSMQAKTTGIHNLDFKAFNNLIVPLPEISVQHSIVSELNKIVGLINIKKSQLNDIETLAQSVFYEMFGDPVENEKGLDISTLGTIAEFKNGINFNKGESGYSYKFLGVSDFQDNKTVNSDSLSDIHLTENISKDYMLQTGDIVFVRSNGSKELVGRNILVNINEPTTFSGFCIRCRLTNSEFNSIYLLYLLKAPSMRPIITNSGRGCNISNLNQKILSALPIMHPSISLQESFATRISIFEQQKQQISSSINDLETLLASRMQYWFNQDIT